MASLFYDLDPLSQAAVNLFHGWGYNFYRVENQLRADDQLVRAKATFLLGLAAAQIRAAEDAYRREYLPAPSRAKPFPDSAAVTAAQRLERMVATIHSLEGVIQAQPVPENDRMTERYRREADTLYTLVQSDQVLIGQCDLLRSLTEGKDGAQLLRGISELEEGVAAIRATLTRRATILYS